MGCCCSLCFCARGLELSGTFSSVSESENEDSFTHLGTKMHGASKEVLEKVLAVAVIFACAFKRWDGSLTSGLGRVS
jgi:hypothetical protein